MRDYEDRCRAEGLDVNLIVNSERGGQQSDELFCRETLQMVDTYLQAGGRPTRWFVQSWYPHPKQMVPETAPNTMTALVKAVIHKIPPASADGAETSTREQQSSATAPAHEPAEITFSQSAAAVDVYDFVEVTVNVPRPTAVNPFTEVVVAGEFSCDDGEPRKVDGFCDAQDGSVFRIRLMPTKPGLHRYSVTYRLGDFAVSHAGTFTSRDAGRRGLVRVDSAYPWHLLWDGTGEHYFWNGTTTY